MLKQFLLKNHIIISEQPNVEIWDLLKLQIANKWLSSKAKRDKFKENEVQTLNTYWQQSHELFEASKLTSHVTSPILDFYSYSLLAKIMIIVNSDKRSETLQQSHGLKFILRNGSNIDDMKLIVRIQNRGTFHELLECSRRDSDLSYYTDCELDIDTILNYDLDVFEHDDFHTKVHPIHGLSFNKTDDGKYKIELQLAGKITAETFAEYCNRHPDLCLDKFEYSIPQRKFAPGFIIGAIFSEKDKLPDFIYERSYKNEQFIYPPIIIDGKRLQFTQIEIKYLVAFALSNMARYYPNEWQNFVSRENYFWRTKKSFYAAKRAIPNLILNAISEEYFVVMPPGSRKWK